MKYVLTQNPDLKNAWLEKAYHRLQEAKRFNATKTVNFYLASLILNPQLQYTPTGMNRADAVGLAKAYLAEMIKKKQSSPKKNAPNDQEQEFFPIKSAQPYYLKHSVPVVRVSEHEEELSEEIDIMNGSNPIDTTSGNTPKLDNSTSSSSDNENSSSSTSSSESSDSSENESEEKNSLEIEEQGTQLLASALSQGKITDELKKYLKLRYPNVNIATTNNIEVHQLAIFLHCKKYDRKQITEQLNRLHIKISKTSVNRILNYNGINLDKTTDAMREQIFERYLSVRASHRDIVFKYTDVARTIAQNLKMDERKIIHRFESMRRGESEKNEHLTEDLKGQIIKMYLAGKTYPEIKKSTSLSFIDIVESVLASGVAVTHFDIEVDRSKGIIDHKALIIRTFHELTTHEGMPTIRAVSRKAQVSPKTCMTVLRNAKLIPEQKTISKHIKPDQLEKIIKYFEQNAKTWDQAGLMIKERYELLVKEFTISKTQAKCAIEKFNRQKRSFSEMNNKTVKKQKTK